MTEKEQKILDMQCASTKKALTRPESEELAHFSRLFGPSPEGHKAVPNAKSWEEAVRARSLTREEVAVEGRLRQKRGQLLAEMRKEPSGSSVGEEKKARGIRAFLLQTFDDIMSRAESFFKKPESTHQKLVRELEEREKRLNIRVTQLENMKADEVLVLMSRNNEK